MVDSNKILNEQCPYLREIWVAGYDEVIKEHSTQELLLIRKSDRFIKRIPMFRLADKPYKIITARLYSGEIHKWISEADGSCERFRKLIS
jgi:hypothetical protein